MLVLVEKQTYASTVDPILRKQYPGVPLDYLIVHPYGLPFVYDYPRNLRWSDYPVTLTARYRLKPEMQFALARQANGRCERISVDYTALGRGQDAIACVDRSPAAIAAAVRMRQHLEALGVITQWRGMFTPLTLDDASLTQALQAPMPPEAVEHACAQWQVKANFDYSFLVNSAGLLTRSYVAVGGSFPEPVFSKYTVQTLYAIRNMELAGEYRSEGAVHERLYAWKGTGRYVDKKESIGGSASRSQLLDTLKELGLIVPTNEQAKDCARKASVYLN